ncbi:ferrous iron transport protein B [Candidatus Sumerlaeota bacterium]|nr:ferrous iron transport protein B [Candidatus Sumerlaeota bacterium]
MNNNKKISVGKTTKIVALAGNPNCGKSTIFNRLTGAHQRVGNWPGVTVERKEGEFELNHIKFKVVDLPGTYALSARSLDEKIARDFILEGKPDIIVNIVNATSIERNLYLTMILLEMGCPLVVALNMIDLVEKEGLEIDASKLSSVLGVPVVKTAATKGVGIQELKEFVVSYSATESGQKFCLSYGNSIEKILSKIEQALREQDIPLAGTRRWQAVKILENDPVILQKLESVTGGTEIILKAQEQAKKFERAYGLELESAIIERRYGFIHGLVKECVSRRIQPERRINITDKVDQIVVNKYLGIPLFLIAMWLTFQLVFTVGNPLADLIDAFFGWLAEATSGLFTAIGLPDMLISLVADGIISGVGSVLVFLPNILILFLIIAILEDSGYMARAAFVTDRFMHTLGLHGKSFIPMLLGFGCNIPAVMGTRILESRKDRILTILIIPFMSCTARLPIYILFTGAFFAQYQGWIIFGLYLFGILVAVLSAQLFKALFFRQEVAPLIMELPPYHLPTIRGILIHTWQRGSLFLRKAGTIIFAAVVLVWVLASFPPGVEYASHQSIIGHIGKLVAPLLKPAGFGNWESAISLIFGFIAKEVVVGTMGTIYGASGEGLRAVIQQHFTPLSALAFMFFSLIYVPCVATIATIWKEIGKKWALFSMAYSTGLAWVVAVLIYQIGRLIG